MLEVFSAFLIGFAAGGTAIRWTIVRRLERLSMEDVTLISKLQSLLNESSKQNIRLLSLSHRAVDHISTLEDRIERGYD
jgi:hypothetical protein